MLFFSILSPDFAFACSLLINERFAAFGSGCLCGLLHVSETLLERLWLMSEP